VRAFPLPALAWEAPRRERRQDDATRRSPISNQSAFHRRTRSEPPFARFREGRVITKTVFDHLPHTNPIENFRKRGCVAARGSEVASRALCIYRQERHRCPAALALAVRRLAVRLVTTGIGDTSPIVPMTELDVITIQGRTRSWKISPSPGRTPSPTERTNTASSSSDAGSGFMHVGGAGSESDESEDEGEEQRGLGSKSLERINLTVPGTLGHHEQGDESPMPEEATTAAWERLMQPTQMNLPPSATALPWALPGPHDPIDDEHFYRGSAEAEAAAAAAATAAAQQGGREGRRAG